MSIIYYYENEEAHCLCLFRMKTSTIAVRVADFLRQNAPFDLISASDVVNLASTGRVKFHEVGELIFEEGNPREPFLYVIQQGTVRLLKYGPGGEELVDMRTEGDLLGISWLLGENEYTNTAKADSDTLLYALPWDDFLPCAQKYPEVGRYLAAYFSAHPGDNLTLMPADALPSETDSATEGEDSWLDLTQPLDERIRRNLIVCREDFKVREAARQMAQTTQEAVVVVDKQGCPVGILTETDIVNRVATGEVPVEAPVSRLMSQPVICVPPGLPIREILLKMMHHKLRHLCVTADGSARTAVVGLIAEQDVQLLHGRVPSPIAKELMAATDAEAMSVLRERVEELVLLFLEGRTPLSWLGEFLAEIDRIILERCLHLTQAELLAEGLRNPELPFAWLALGREGRKERFLRTGQKNAIVYANPSAGQEKEAEVWFQRLADGVTLFLSRVGYEGLSQTMADNREWCRPIREWESILHEWIMRPIDHAILTKVPFFDFRMVVGDAKLASSLRRTIDREIHRNPLFIPLMANDSLENLPPLTIFRDSVMDQEGVLWTCVDTKLHAMRPLADAARVMALQLGMLETTSTVERFRAAAQSLPRYANLFEDAAEASRVALFYQTLYGLRRGDDGRYIRPAELRKIDHEKLKSVFRVVVRVLDFMQEYFNLKP